MNTITVASAVVILCGGGMDLLTTRVGVSMVGFIIGAVGIVCRSNLLLFQVYALHILG